MSRTQPEYKSHIRNPELWLKDKKEKKVSESHTSQRIVNHLLNSFVQNRTRLRAEFHLTIGKQHL